MASVHHCFIRLPERQRLPRCYKPHRLGGACNRLYHEREKPVATTFVLGPITLHFQLKIIITLSHVHYTLNSNHNLTQLFVLLFIFSYSDVLAYFVLRPLSSFGIM